MEETFKIVKVTVWTANLATLSMTPVPREYANEHAGEEGLESMEGEGGAPRDFFFCNGEEDGAVRLTIQDGGNEQQFEKLPLVNICEMLDVRNAEKDRNGEFENEDAVLECFAEYFDKDSYVVAWKTLKALKTNALPEFLGSEDVFGYIQKEARLQDESFKGDGGGDGVFFVQCGSMGKGMVHFEIDLPEREEFDVRKLHFLNRPEWWDNSSGMDELQDAFEGQDVLLDCVEYGGRLFERSDADFSPLWKYIVDAKFRDTALHEFGET